MNIADKISPAFSPFLANSGSYDRHEAIVIYHSPTARLIHPGPGPCATEQRRSYVCQREAMQRPVEERILEHYLTTLSGTRRGQRDFRIATLDTRVLPVASVEVTRATLRTLAEREEVLAILPNQKVQLIAPQAIRYSGLAAQERADGMTWGLRHLRIPELWSVTRGAGVTVAVLDTGVHGDHPSLRKRVRRFALFDAMGREVSAQPSFDSGLHGTHVCGIIAGSRSAEGIAIGVAPEAELLVAAVLVGDTTVWTILQGIAWAIENGADVINLSLGLRYYEPNFALLFDDLLDNYNIIPVVAIGNDCHGNSSSPGNAPSALAVGAVELMGRGKTEVAFFSSGASLVFPGRETDGLVTKPDIVAPGVQIFSCIPPQQRPDGIYEYTYMDGTSMAAPHVAGVCALLMAACPEAPAREIIAAIKDTALHPDGVEYRPDNRWGYGLIQPVEAMQALARYRRRIESG